MGRQLPGRNLWIPGLRQEDPLTDEERERPGDTSNIFRLPDFYHFGVGSAGFGAYRELAGHLKATAWILDEAMESFPLLYYCRVVPLLELSPAPWIDAGFVMAGGAAFFPPEQWIGTIRTPLLVIHGDDDGIVRIADGQRSLPTRRLRRRCSRSSAEITTSLWRQLGHHEEPRTWERR